MRVERLRRMSSLIWFAVLWAAGCAAPSGEIEQDFGVPIVAGDRNQPLKLFDRFFLFEPGKPVQTADIELSQDVSAMFVLLSLDPRYGVATVERVMPANASPGVQRDVDKAYCRTEPESQGGQSCVIAPPSTGTYRITVNWLVGSDAFTRGNRPPAAQVQGIGLPEPLPMSQHFGLVGYKEFPGQLFLNRTNESWDQKPEGVCARDTVQGEAGDCYFLAGAAALAEVHPEIVARSIHENGDGTYTVRFFRPDVTPPEPVDVRITGLLPLAPNGLPAYTSSPTPFGDDPWELWPMLLEKAFAKYSGGYDAIGNGGTLIYALAITGLPTFPVALEGADPEGIFSMVQDIEKRGGLMIAGTRPLPPGATDGAVRDFAEATGLLPGHAYTIFGAKVKEDGRHVIVLRNPWARFEPLHDGSTDNGIFEMPPEQFVHGFFLMVGAFDPNAAP